MTGTVLRTPRLVLRPVEPADEPDLAAIQRSPEVARWWGAVYEPEDDEDDVVQLAVVLDGRVIGLIQYAEETDPMYRSAGLDLFLDPAVHGRGYGREAIVGVARHLIQDRGHHRLTIDPAAANTRAIAIYESIGFRPVGVLRQYERDPSGSEWHDGLLLELLAGELID